MLAPLLKRVLHATGYDNAKACQSDPRHARSFLPDACFTSASSLKVYFKYAAKHPGDSELERWRREIWNEGFAPLLWLVCPDRIDLYNGFGAPEKDGAAQKHLLESFKFIAGELQRLDAKAGRLAFETGQFWQNYQTVNRKTGVDKRLLRDLSLLERDLCLAGSSSGVAQGLIGRVIFTQYLLDRHIVTSPKLQAICGHADLPSCLRDARAASRLFTWSSETFNGDMFPRDTQYEITQAPQLARIADFLQAIDPVTGQQNLFPYQFELIPVELISSIYEQFAHADTNSSDARKNSVHYTRLSLVALVLDEVMAGLPGNATILDLTCGSGVFLVEALRRLVMQRAKGQRPTRQLIRDTLYRQIVGVDISEAAIRVAAFSLYLAALELDPDPFAIESLKFEALIGKTLFVADAHLLEHDQLAAKFFQTATGLRRFDVIVGNPPWSFRGSLGTLARRARYKGDGPSQSRGESLDFVLRALDFAHEQTRFGLVLAALPFFSRSANGMAAVMDILGKLAPVTMVNLANLRSWLFATADMPAMALFARHRPQQRTDRLTMVQIPWQASGKQTFTFDISPGDVQSFPWSALVRQPLLLKTTAIGRKRDFYLLQQMMQTHQTLGQQLATLSDGFGVGLIYGNQSQDAVHLLGKALLDASHLSHFAIDDNLPTFAWQKVERPRNAKTFKAPLLLIKETLNKLPRAVVAVSENDVVFTNATYGVHLPDTEMAHLIAAILGSSLASWFLLMTSAEFGIKKMRFLCKDIEQLPIPDLPSCLASEKGQRLAQHCATMHKRSITDDDWRNLDHAVMALYELDAQERTVVHDGWVRAGWQWQAGQQASNASAEIEADLKPYAESFMMVLNTWLVAGGTRSIRAEIMALPKHCAISIVRFVIAPGNNTPVTNVVVPEGDLQHVLNQIEQRLRVKISAELHLSRTLRVHGKNEVIIIKPAARRHWLASLGLEDADAVIADSMRGGNA